MLNKPGHKNPLQEASQFHKDLRWFKGLLNFYWLFLWNPKDLCFFYFGWKYDFFRTGFKDFHCRSPKRSIEVLHRALLVLLSASKVFFTFSFFLNQICYGWKISFIEPYFFYFFSPLWCSEFTLFFVLFHFEAWKTNCVCDSPSFSWQTNCLIVFSSNQTLWTFTLASLKFLYSCDFFRSEVWYSSWDFFCWSLGCFVWDLLILMRFFKEFDGWK